MLASTPGRVLETQMSTLTVVLALILPDAYGFCGTYVGAPGEELTNSTSQLVVVRSEEGRTTLTMSNDYAGSLVDFAAAIPIPPPVLWLQGWLYGEIAHSLLRC
jgi:hypothetical protein